MELAANGRRVLIVKKRRSGRRKSATSYLSGRPGCIQRLLRRNKYLPELRVAAVRRASASLNCPKPEKVKRKRACPSKSS